MENALSHKPLHPQALPVPPGLDVDGLVRGVGRAFGAGVPVPSYPLQGKVVRLHGQAHGAKHYQAETVPLCDGDRVAE